MKNVGKNIGKRGNYTSFNLSPKIPAYMNLQDFPKLFALEYLWKRFNWTWLDEGFVKTQLVSTFFDNKKPDGQQNLFSLHG